MRELETIQEEIIKLAEQAEGFQTEIDVSDCFRMNLQKEYDVNMKIYSQKILEEIRENIAKHTRTKGENKGKYEITMLKLANLVDEKQTLKNIKNL